MHLLRAIDIIWLLLIQGYNPRSKDHEGNTLLQKAVHSKLTTPECDERFFN